MKLNIMQSMLLMQIFFCYQVDEIDNAVPEDLFMCTQLIQNSGPWSEIFSQLQDLNLIDEDLELTPKGLQKGHSMINGLNFKQISKDYHIFALAWGIKFFTEGIQYKIEKMKDFNIHLDTQLHENLLSSAEILTNLLSSSTSKESSVELEVAES